MDVHAFDLDGTLLASSDVDAKLYLESVRAVLGDIELRRDWSTYQRVTDQGILRSIIRDNGLPDESRLIGRVRQRFIRSMRDHLQAHGPFDELPGARNFVRRLHGCADARVVYATGGWRDSAWLKLQTAGFPVDGIPLASSDDHEDRASIMLHAVAGISGKVDRITYYGDGVWDQAACEKLRWRFVAVGKALGGIEAFE